jgi:hypothetical protein
VVLFIGSSGVGKFTIAKAVCERMGKYNYPSRLINHHVLTDPAAAIEPVQNAAHYEVCKSIRRAALEELKNIDDPKLVIMFTATLTASDLSTSPHDMEQFKDYVGLAEARKVPLVVINLLCDLKENAKRLCDEKRKYGGNAKLVDVSTLEKIRSDTTLFGREQVLAGRDHLRTIYLELDVTEMDLLAERETVWEVLCEVR